MKKILLIIIIVFLIFQMVVLAVAIDIGDAAIDRGNTSTPRTFVAIGNPANATGTITSIEVWFHSVETLDVEVATFFVVSGNNLSTRDTESIGTVSGQSKQTFPVDLEVEEGDYIGVYWSSGDIEMDYAGGDGLWYGGAGVDYIPCTNQLFSVTAGDMISVYGTGTTEEEEEVNIIFFGTNF